MLGTGHFKATYLRCRASIIQGDYHPPVQIWAKPARFIVKHLDHLPPTATYTVNQCYDIETLQRCFYLVRLVLLYSRRVWAITLFAAQPLPNRSTSNATEAPHQGRSVSSAACVWLHVVVLKMSVSYNFLRGDTILRNPSTCHVLPFVNGIIVHRSKAFTHNLRFRVERFMVST